MDLWYADRLSRWEAPSDEADRDLSAACLKGDEIVSKGSVEAVFKGEVVEIRDNKAEVVFDRGEEEEFSVSDAEVADFSFFGGKGVWRLSNGRAREDVWMEEEDAVGE